MEPNNIDMQNRLEHDGAEPVQAEVFAQRALANHADCVLASAPTYTKNCSQNHASSHLEDHFEKIQITEEKEKVTDPMVTFEQYLITSMNRLYSPNEEGDTPLHMAVVLERIEDFGMILQHTYIQCYLDCQNHRGQTALHLAVAAGQLEMARALLVCGASLTVQDRLGRTPLHIACEKSDLAAVKVLTDPLLPYELKMADDLKYSIERHQIPQNGDIKNYEGEPCMHTAAKAGSLEIVKHLVKCGHNINVQELKGGKTVLHLAVEYGNARLVEYLLRQEATDSYAEDYSGYSALVLAHYHPAALQIIHQLRPKVTASLHNEFLDLVNGDEDVGMDDTMCVG